MSRSNWMCSIGRSVVAGLVSWAFVGGAQAALQGRDLDGSAADGYEAYYDTVLNITWLADANYAKTSGFDADGAMTWDKASTWAAGLDYFGTTGWRLPTVKPVNGVNFVEWPSTTNGSTDIGYNITSPQSELAYMYYVNLGLSGAFKVDGSFNPAAGVNSSGLQPIPDLAGSFIHNFKSNMYWTNVVNTDVLKSWGFWTSSFVAGAQGKDYRYNDHFAWAVHDGDPFKVASVGGGSIPAVDEPATAWMLLAGLGIAMHATRKRRGLSRG